MAGKCQILVVQGSSTYLSEYNLISLGFLFSSNLIIMKESYVSIVFLIISGTSLRRKFNSFSQVSPTLQRFSYWRGVHSQAKNMVIPPPGKILPRRLAQPKVLISPTK